MFGLGLLGKLSVPILLTIAILWLFTKLQQFMLWLLRKLFPSYFSNSQSSQLKVTSKPSFTLRLVKHIVVGLATFSIVFYLFEVAPNLMESEESKLDRFMYYISQLIPPKPSAKIPSFVLIDIEEKTIAEWSIKHYTPRNKLVNLIETAVKTEPKLIIVDVDISKKVKDNSENDILINYLRKYSEQCQTNKCPPVIFIRGLSIVEKQQFYNLTSDFTKLEEIIEKHPNLLHWASANFIPLGTSKTIRGWKLWLPTCNSENKPGIIPSVQLLTRELLQGGSEQDIQSGLSQLLPNCSGNKAILPKISTYKGLNISTIAEDIRHRIIYRIPYKNSEILQIFPAHDFFNHSNLNFNEKIVVIGSQFGDRENTYHTTPINNNLPGSILVINAIYSLLQYGIIEPIPILGWLLIALFLIVVITLTYFLTKKIEIKSSTKWKTVSLIIILAIVFYGVTAFSLYQFSIWLNIAIFSLILQTLFLFQDAEELYNDKE